MTERQERIDKLLKNLIRDQEIGIRGGIADPAIKSHVRMLCEQRGYGNVIATASTLWREKDPSGAFCYGPCAGVVKRNLQEAAALGIRSDCEFDSLDRDDASGDEMLEMMDDILFEQQFPRDRRATIVFIDRRVRMRTTLAMMEWAKTDLFEDPDDILDAWSHAENLLQTAVKIIELEARLAGEQLLA